MRSCFASHQFRFILCSFPGCLPHPEVTFSASLRNLDQSKMRSNEALWFIFITQRNPQTQNLQLEMRCKGLKLVDRIYQELGRNAAPTIFSAVLKAIADMSIVGFTPGGSGRTDPSTTYKSGYVRILLSVPSRQKTWP
jgi:hypothetical protein